MPRPGSGRESRLAVARLARDYLDANSDRPIALPELCAVTGVSVRTLNYAFKLSFGIPPGAYHFFQRLRLARDDLLRSHRAEASVTQIAYDRGFWHLGRFAVDYRSLFGEPPSRTLYRRA